jgi:dephospho-CoA kinase
MEEDVELVTAIKNHFGDNAYVEGKLNRTFLATQVFNQPYKLQQLNALVHPAVINAADKWFAAQQAVYVVKEAALIFESGSQLSLDKVIGVFAQEALRINRVMKRNLLTREAVLARMDKQIDESIKMKLCDFVVNNNNLELVIPQVLNIHQQLLHMSSS